MEDEHRQVFQTKSPKRYYFTKWSVRILVVLLVLITVIVSITILKGKNPSMPTMKSVGNSYKTKLDPSNPFTFQTKLNKKFKGFKEFLKKKISEDEESSLPVDTKRIRGAFYTPWSSLALTDLERYGHQLNTIYPEWFFINPKTLQLDSRIDKRALAIMKKHGLSIQPIFNNYVSVPGKEGGFSPELLHKILHNPAAQDRLIAVPDYSEYMSEEKALVANLKKVFLMVSGAALQKYMTDIEKQQHLLLNASEILNQIYMAESALLRAEKHFDTDSVQAAIARLNLYKAVEKINVAAKEGIVSFAEGDEQRMMLSGLRRFTKYTNTPNVVALTEKIAAHYIEKGTY